MRSQWRAALLSERARAVSLAVLALTGPFAPISIALAIISSVFVAVLIWQFWMLDIRQLLRRGQSSRIERIGNANPVDMNMSAGSATGKTVVGQFETSRFL